MIITIIEYSKVLKINIKNLLFVVFKLQKCFYMIYKWFVFKCDNTMERSRFIEIWFLFILKNILFIFQQWAQQKAKVIKNVIFHFIFFILVLPKEIIDNWISNLSVFLDFFRKLSTIESFHLELYKLKQLSDIFDTTWSLVEIWSWIYIM